MINNEVEAHETLMQDPVDGVGVRVTKGIAKKWLGENKSMICGGYVFHFKIKSLGLGVYKVTKAHSTIKETMMIR